jgi:hypothetical protein
MSEAQSATLPSALRARDREELAEVLRYLIRLADKLPQAHSSAQQQGARWREASALPAPGSISPVRPSCRLIGGYAGDHSSDGIRIVGRAAASDSIGFTLAELRSGADQQGC